MGEVKECPGCKRHALGYIAWHRDADQRHKKGQKQKQCPVCKLWCWPDELRSNLPIENGSVGKV